MGKKLKICIVSREYPPHTLWGGIGTFTYNLAHGLKNVGHDVDVLAFTLWEEEHAEDNGIHVHRISSPKVPFKQKTYWDYATSALSPFAFFYSFKIRKKIEALHRERDYDVIDFPEHIGEGFFTALTKKYPTLVRLFTPLSLIGHMGLNRSTNALDYFLFGLMEKSSIRQATAINAPSRNLAELVGKAFRIRRPIEVIYNPIDSDKFSPDPGVHTNSDGLVKVLFVGRLEDRKGVHILARAIPRVVLKAKNARFIILGSDCRGVNGFHSMKDFMLQIFREQGVAEHVEFRDPIPYDTLPALYNSADISVVPSLYDNSPYTCLEAMSCGLPVVSTSAGGMQEYIDHGKNGIIVPPSDVKALAEALTALLLDPAKRQAYGIAAREKAVQEFKREVVAAKLTRLYLRTIEKYWNSAGKRQK